MLHETVLKHSDKLGGPSTYPQYAAGRAVAGDSPFEWTKQVASSYEGTRNGMVIHWPKGIAAKGELRSQWHHVIDKAPSFCSRDCSDGAYPTALIIDAKGNLYGTTSAGSVNKNGTIFMITPGPSLFD
jgi:hypothetical protein